MGPQNLPTKAVIVVHNPTKDCIDSIKNQTYREVELFSGNFEKAPILYNQAILKHNNVKVFGFIDGNCILDQNCVQAVCDKLDWSTSQFCGAVYTDEIVVNKQGIGVHQHYFPFVKSTFRTNLINPYIFLNGAIKTPLFDETLDVLYYYDALVKVGNSAMVYHLPKLLMVNKTIPKDVSKDLEKLKINVTS
jgi:hypothetical protein